MTRVRTVIGGLAVISILGLAGHVGRAHDPAYPDVETDDDFFKQLTLELGLAKGRARLEWAERCIERINKRA